MTDTVDTYWRAPDPEETRWRVALLRAFQEVAEDAIDEVMKQLESVPTYRKIEPAIASEVRHSVRWTVDSFAKALIQDRRLLTAEEESRLEVIGAERARVGVPLVDVTATFDLAFDCCQQRLVELAAKSADPTAMRCVGGLARDLRYLATQAVAALQRGHTSEAGHQVMSRTRDRSAFLESVLIGDDPVRLTEHAAKFGLEPTRGWTLFVLLPSRQASDVLHGLRAATRALAANLPNAITTATRTTPSMYGVVLAPNAVLEGSGAWAKCDTLVIDHELFGFVQVFDELGRVAERFLRLQSALHVLSRLPRRAGLVLARVYESYELLAGYSAAEARGIIGLTLGPLLPGDGLTDESLLQSAEVLAEERGNEPASGRRMGMSRGAMAYRRERILEIAGLDVRDPDTCFRVVLASRLLRIHGRELYGFDSAAPATFVCESRSVTIV